MICRVLQGTSPTTASDMVPMVVANGEPAVRAPLPTGSVAPNWRRDHKSRLHNGGGRAAYAGMRGAERLGLVASPEHRCRFGGQAARQQRSTSIFLRRPSPTGAGCCSTSETRRLTMRPVWRDRSNVRSPMRIRIEPENGRCQYPTHQRHKKCLAWL